MIRALLLAVAVLLPGCMARIQLSALQPPPAQQTASDTRPRIWYVGLGLYDETWSEGDVTAAANALIAERSQDYQLVPIVLSYGRQHRFPTPARANVVAVMSDIARRARPDDLVLLYVSTHGGPGLLAREADGQELEPANPEEVAQWLAPLGARPTVLVLSACFSGSFIPALSTDSPHHPGRRKARAHLVRTRRAGAEHTVFGQAVLDALATPSISLRSLVERVRGEVAARERELRVTQPSEPQVFVGQAVRGLYQAPVF